MKDDPRESQDSQPQHEENPHPDAAGHGAHRVGTLGEFLVRETLSDLENRLTADHHLNDDPPDPDTGDAPKRHHSMDHR
jgi:hypothetical protein